MTTPQQVLKPCPFCGGSARIALGEHDFNGAEVFCNQCEASSGHFSDDAKGEAAADHWNARAESATLAALGGQPVASIYITADGAREFDDWKHDLPVGRTVLYSALALPPAQPAPAPVDEREPVNMDKARAAFEAINKDSHDYQRSARGTYRNPPIARDWKWFQLGIYHATEGAK